MPEDVGAARRGQGHPCERAADDRFVLLQDRDQLRVRGCLALTVQALQDSVAGHWPQASSLLVLLVGGHNPDKFSFGYLVQMGVGVSVGILVNLLVFPPLHFKAAALSLAFPGRLEVTL